MKQYHWSQHKDSCMKLGDRIQINLSLFSYYRLIQALSAWQKTSANMLQFSLSQHHKVGEGPEETSVPQKEKIIYVKVWKSLSSDASSYMHLEKTIILNSLFPPPHQLTNSQENNYIKFPSPFPHPLPSTHQLP